jgi:hypothetical protein
MKPSLLSVNAPRTRRQSLLQRPAGRIALHIDELVLDGFARVDAGRMQSSLRETLTASLQRGGDRFGHDVHVESAGGTHDLQSGDDAESIGARLGKTLLKTLQAAGSDSRRASVGAAKNYLPRQGKGQR